MAHRPLLGEDGVILSVSRAGRRRKRVRRFGESTEGEGEGEGGKTEEEQEDDLEDERGDGKRRKMVEVESESEGIEEVSEGSDGEDD
jgi:hypothetical protein